MHSTQKTIDESSKITELLNAGIITPEIAERINNYYNTKSGPPQNKVVIVFGILGALLVGLGIILILASNWDDLPRSVKTVIAFIPLLIGQFCCGYTLIKKEDSMAWREASSVFLIIAIGASISLRFTYLYHPHHLVRMHGLYG